VFWKRRGREAPREWGDSPVLVFLDAENAQASPDEIRDKITTHSGKAPTKMVAYSKWSANSPNLKKVRDAGFRCIQADTGENNADIMMCLDAYEEVRDRLEKGEFGTVYVCFHGDKGFTHLLEKIKALQGWKSVWVTSNTKTVKMIENSASERLLITKVQPTNKPPEKEKKPNWLEKADYELLKSEINSVATEPMSLGQLGSRLTISLKLKYGEDMTAKKFTHERGIPKSWNLAKIFRRYLKDDYYIEDKSSNPIISPLNVDKVTKIQSNIPTSNDVEQSNKLDNMMRIPGFSKAGRGGGEFTIKMPVEPEKVKQLLLFIESKRNTCATWAELKQMVLESQIESKRRTEPVFRFYKRSLDQVGSDIDWGEIIKPIEMASLIEGYILDLYNQKEGLQEFNTIEVRSAIGDYFSDVKQKISQESLNKFPRVVGFNTGNGGLRYPTEPEILSNLLIINSGLEIELNKKERVEFIHSKLKDSKNRVNVVLIRLMGLDLMNIQSPLQAFEGLKSHFFTSADEGGWSLEDFENIKKYFQQVQANLSNLVSV